MDNDSFALTVEDIMLIKKSLLDFVTKERYTNSELAILPRMTELLLYFRDICI